MNLRNIVLLAGLAVFMAGCVINPRPLPPRDFDHRYDDDYYDYRSTPSYEGYYYARIIFISNVPYYVDDDRYIRPIPPRLHDHFRRYPYDTLGRPPVFSRDAEVRDGYPVSRIIYLDGVPYHVENDRIAQPLPERLHQRFRYAPANQGNAPANGNRPQPPAQSPAQHDNGRNNEPPVHVQDRKRDETGPNGPDRERIKQPLFERGQREGESKAPADSQGKTAPSPDRRILPLRPDQPTAGQPNAGESHADTPNGKERGRNGNHPQAVVDTGKKNADKKPVDKKKSLFGKKDKQGDSTKANDDSGNKKDNGDKKDNRKKSPWGKDDNQEGK